ncbi:MAG: flagellar protein export ATPase FliI [Pirellulaceae bacterium]|nr:MAG: flagellar protein export ATPase FliI [Pirellulaceae bacterium]
MTRLVDFQERLAQCVTAALSGRVVTTEGHTLGVAGFPAPVGSLVAIERQAGPPLGGEVIGFRHDLALVAPFGELTGIRCGNRVTLQKSCQQVPVGPALLGRVISALGEPLDGRPPPQPAARMFLHRRPPPAVQRPTIRQPLATGVRAIDGLLTCGRGQRLGVFAAAGVGKSVLLGMMTRFSEADVTVIGLIGERGREVNEFLERDLGETGRQRSVVVVATSDEPAVLRVRAAFTATAIAEYFRDQGKHVLLIMDSLTRFALAQREIGLAAGEPPATRGFPPSVFAWLPRLVERAGTAPRGSITAFYSVLVEGDDPLEPVSDAVRGLLDGHILLSRRLANQAHYPAIDLLESLSRLMPQLVAPEHLAAAAQIRQWQAVLREAEDLISVGAYRPGSNPLLDLALRKKESVDAFLRQSMTELAPWPSTVQQLIELTRNT